MDFPIFSHDFPSYKHPFIEIFHYHRLSTGGQLYPQPQATPVASSGIIISIETTMRISIKPFELKPLFGVISPFLNWLVVSTPLKHISQLESVGMIIPNIWKKTCSKPPTS
jgi:hypothetical protein